MSVLEISGARLVTARDVRSATLVAVDGRFAASAAGAERQFLDLKDHLVFPGLLNAHDHLSLNALPCPVPIPPQANAYDWSDLFQPYFSHPDFARAKAIDEAMRAVHGGLKNLLAGTTTVAHHDPWLDVLDHPAFPVHVLRDAPFCHSLRYAGSYGPTVAESFSSTRPWFIHLAEGSDEVAGGELAALEALHALGETTVLVHAVGLSRKDKARVLAAGASVVWCPTSNLNTLGQTLDPRPFLKEGRLALATDSRFTGSFHLLHEMRVARDVSGLSAREIFGLVTEGPARLMRTPDRGTLDEGAVADLVIARDPGGDPYEAILRLGRGDFVAVVRGGRILIADPELAESQAGEGEWRCVTVDGRAKLVRPEVLAWPEAAALEPGLVVGLREIYGASRRRSPRP